MTPALAVVTLPCDRCGAALLLTGDCAAIECRYCRASQHVSPELRERARAYADAIRRAWADELESRYHAQLSANTAEKTGPFFRWMIAFALLVPTWLTLGQFVPAHLPQWLNVIVVVLSIGVFARLVQLMATMAVVPRVELLLGRSLGECPACGAPVAIPEGDVAIVCRYCGSSSLPSPQTKQHVLAGARSRLGVSSSLRDDHYRDVVARANDAGAVFGRLGRGASSVGCITAFLVTGALALTGAIVTALMLLPKTDGATPTGWIGPCLGLGAAGVIVLAVLYARRVRAAQRAFEQRIGRPLRMIQQAQARPYHPRAG